MIDKKKIIIINSGLGNINSLINCVDSLQFNYKVIEAPNENEEFDKIIFPGVGSYNFVMKSIIKKKWGLFIKKNILEKNKHYLGICIGMQILSNYGYENEETHGLGIIDSEVKILNSDDKDLKIPHIGWNDVEKVNDSEIFDGIKNNSDFYFDHSYVMKLKNASEITTQTEYEKKFVSSVKKNNVYGVQFHPEKSADNGKKILYNFLRL